MILAAVVFGFLAFAVQPKDRFTSDFYSFWAGAKLVGPELYDVRRADGIQHAVSPLVESNPYVRPPYYALALWPLGQLPFPVAYVAWFVLNLCAVIAFVWIWKLHPGSYIACALFLPLGWSFGLGQDAPLLLAIFALGAALIERYHEIAGGAVLALCAIKPHLFLFVPVVLLAQRRHRALAGMLGAGAALYLVSSAMLGADWPATFMRATLVNEARIRPRLLGLAGLIARFGAPKWLLAVLMIGGVYIVYRQARRAGWLVSAAFALAVGVAFAPRAMVYDATFFLPLLLLCSPPLRVIAIGLLLITVVTPAALAAELGSIAILLLAPAWRTDFGYRSAAGIA